VGVLCDCRFGAIFGDFLEIMSRGYGWQRVGNPKQSWIFALDRLYCDSHQLGGPVGYIRGVVTFARSRLRIACDAIIIIRPNTGDRKLLVIEKNSSSDALEGDLCWFHMYFH